MKTPPTSTTPALKLPRRSAAASNEPWPPAPGAAGELAEEFERLRACEENLRAYEARLRAWQERLESGAAAAPEPATPVPAQALSRGPCANEAGLQEAWRKFYRSRELLEAEERHLRDERLMAQGRETELKRREQAVALREKALAEHERAAAERAAAAEAAAQAAATTASEGSRLGQLTQAPFAFAKAVFSGK
ncbi:MAG: hypothetical protein JSS11_05640 [Verrucomicrobia bacterium]|nr:hypothetical protein [Verrucomicrobiota bacterium]